MGLSRGVAGAEEEAKKARINFGRAEYFKLGDGDSLTFRLIDAPHEWPYIKQHSFVPTRELPADVDQKLKDKWPKRMGAVCRHDEAFKGEYTDCYICDQMVNDRTQSGKFTAPVRLWARMIIRQQVTGTQQMFLDGIIKESQIDKVVGFQDEIVETAETDKDGKETGNKIKHPRIVVANFALDNFFGALQGFADVYQDEGGILNRDITVTRHGEGTDTEYKFAPRTPTPGFDLADPATRAKYEELAAQAHLSVESFERIITDLASDEYYARYFDVTKPFPQNRRNSDDRESGAPAAQQQKPVEDAATQAELEAMRNRVRGGNAAPASTEPQNSFTPSS